MGSDSVPTGWRRAVYGDVLRETEERAGERVDLPVLSVTKTRGPMLASDRFGKALHSRDLSRYRVAPRDVIVADPMLLWDGSIGIQRAADVGLVSPDYRVYAPGDHADPGFMAYVVRSPTMLPHYQGGARGTNVRRNRIARSDFLSIPISLPPLIEQRKIAAILSSMDDAVESTQAVISQLDIVKKAMMVELFARGLPGRHTRFKQTAIGQMPEEWDAAPVGELLASIDAGWSPQCDPRPAAEHEWGVLKVSAVSWGEFRPDENKRLPNHLAPRHDAEVRPGDLLISRANTSELVGRGVLVGTTRPKLMMSDKLLRLRVNEVKASADFLRLALEAPSSRQQIEDGATGSSRSMKNISQEKLRAIVVPHPPLDEQIAFARTMAMVAERARSEEAMLGGLRLVKTALTSALLTGEVRVKLVEGAA